MTADLSGLTTPAGRVALAFVAAVGVLLTWWDGQLHGTVRLALAWTALALLAVTLDGEDRLPMRWTVPVAAVPVANVLVMWVPLATVPRPWLLHMTGPLLGLVALRGRAGAAVVSFGVAAVGLGVWAFTPDGDPVVASALLAVPVIAIVTGVLWRAALVKVARHTVHRRAAEAAAAAAEHAEVLAAVVRRDRLERVEAAVGTLLARVRDGGPLTGAEREECRVQEAALRDELRAPALAVVPLAPAVERARRRGVDVQLMDDRTAPAGTDVGLLRVLAEAVDAARAGRVRLRVLPAGRAVAATALSDDGETVRRLDLAPDGGVLNEG